MGSRASVPIVAPLALVGPTEAIAGGVFVKPLLDSDVSKVRPHEIVLAADGTLALRTIRYDESDGGPVATATAVAYTRGCLPDCATGTVLRPRATLRFSHLMTCQRQRIYGRLDYVLHGDVPVGFDRRARVDLRFTDERGEPSC